MVWPCGRGREEVDYNVISRQEFIVNVGVSLGIDILDDKDKESQNAFQAGLSRQCIILFMERIVNQQL